jgi:uncharacterized protein (TIGR02466 family)
MIENIFPTKIYSTQIDNQDVVQGEIGAIIDQVQFVRSAKVFGYNNEICSMKMDAVMAFNLMNTASTIDRYLRDYCKEIGFEYTRYSVFSWFTRNRTGDQLQIHHHHGVDITGTYYFQAEGDCGDFFFESPVGPAPHSLCYGAQHSRHYVRPETGKLMFFPGWIYHGVLPNDTDKDRIGLSFNISFAK